MPDWLSIHEPVLVNTIGHSAGAIIFGMLLYYFLVDWKRAREERSSLPAIAAALAMLWNLGSLVALSAGPSPGIAIDIIVAGSFSVLSVLPAVLLHISLQSSYRALWISGYILAAAAVVLHALDLLTRAPRFHFAALVLVTVGFAGLTVVSWALDLRQPNRSAGSRLAAMGLFLLAISFVHFGSAHTGMAWSKEIALHHAGLPLALLVLLQGYRFLLLDAFLRFIVNASLSAAALLASTRVLQSPRVSRHLQHPFEAGLLFVSGCLLLAGFVWVRNRTQTFLTRVIFLRSNVQEALQELQNLARASEGEVKFLGCAVEVIARFLHAAQFELTGSQTVANGQITAPTAVLGPEDWNLPAWVQAIVPIRFSRGDGACLLLGARAGGRRYLSEDCGVLSRLAAAVAEHVEQLRSVQMQNLMSQAELKALQAQINPHFLFNSLNTLYGTIDRANPEARRLVLNLADVFRYLLRSERTFVAVDEELKIVRAYMEIEEARLGGKLRTEMEVDPEARRLMIPLLSIQPLVENAVKHGVASRRGAGFVRLTIRAAPEGVLVEVANSGEWDARTLANPAGIGLSNVRRRLALCYGDRAGLDVRAADGLTTVAFMLPGRPSPELLAAV